MNIKDIENLDEYFDYEIILERMLNKVSSQVDKREGSIIYDALAPAAAELAQMYIALKYNIDLVFVDTSFGEYLERLTDQIGIKRKNATYAIKKGSFYDENNELMDIEIGERFSIENLIYKAIEKIEKGIYKMECETAGTIGNSMTGRLIPVNYIKKLAKAELSDVFVPGENEEDDEVLRARYYETANRQAFGGNIYDYKTKTKEIAGVGAVKVSLIWNGPGTVKLTILDSDYNIASNVLVESVQNAICPDFSSEGLGIAPIGHKVTVDTVSKVEIIIEATVTTTEEIASESLKSKIEEKIRNDFVNLRKAWEDSSNIIVRKSKIEALILDIDGVIDVENATINGQDGNVAVKSFEIPVLKEVVLR